MHLFRVKSAFGLLHVQFRAAASSRRVRGAEFRVKVVRPSDVGNASHVLRYGSYDCNRPKLSMNLFQSPNDL